MFIKKSKFRRELEVLSWLSVHGIQEDKQKMMNRIRNACLIMKQEKDYKKLK